MLLTFQTLIWAKSKIIWCLYWLGLGVLSSVGFGTGLHTFLLYLGPHITSVTLAAYECGGLNFPEPPYPEQYVGFICFAWALKLSVNNFVRFFQNYLSRRTGYCLDSQFMEYNVKSTSWSHDVGSRNSTWRITTIFHG